MTWPTLSSPPSLSERSRDCGPRQHTPERYRRVQNGRSGRGTLRRVDVLAGVGEQRHVPRSLERNGEPALVLGASAGLASWLDLAAVGEEAAHAAGILVVDVPRLLDA